MYNICIYYVFVLFNYYFRNSCANKKHWEGFVGCVHYENFVDVEYMVDPMESGPSGGCLERVDTTC